MKYRFHTRVITLLIISSCYFIDSKAQTPNPCAVVAKISPGTADSVLPQNTSISFTSASENATSYRWLYQGMWSGISNQPWNYSTSVGIQTISLVATNGTCSDTATVVYFSPGTPHDISDGMIANYGYSRTNDYATALSGTADGSFIMGGDRYLSGCGTEGLIVKLRDRGCVEWSRSVRDITANFCKNATLTGVYGSPDSNYFISSNLGSVTFKLDKSGNTIWKKRWDITGIPTQFISNKEMAGDPSGNLYFVSGAFGQAFIVAKFDASGNRIWSKYYRLNTYNPNDPFGVPFAEPKGIVWMNDKIFVGGNRSSLGQRDNFLVQIDAATGQTGWQNSYSHSSGWRVTQLSKFGNLLLFGGESGGPTATIIDQQGNALKHIGTSFPGASYPAKLSRAEADANGNIYLMQWVQAVLPLQPYFANYTNFAKVDTFLNKHFGMTYSTTPGGGFFVKSAMNNKNSFGAVAEDFGLVGETSLGSKDLRFFQMNSVFTPTSGFGCGSNAFFIVGAGTVDQQTFQWNADSVIGLTEIPVNHVAIGDAYIQSRYTCADFIDSCSLMKLSGSQVLCNPDRVYTYKVHRNKKCALQPMWELPVGVTIVNQSDSNITLKFPSFGEFKIAAYLTSCIPVKDSLTIRIDLKYPLNIGRDTSICNNTAITLRAGRYYQNYNWSNGSTDSSISITQPGIYWVEIVDSCGYRQRDSIRIDNFNFPITIGPDRKKCNNDTIHLSAPDGFLNYRWSNDYNINSTTAQHVVVNPLVDTVYYLSAEKLPGCFSFDTVRIESHQSPTIRLGNDTSFCIGTSATFDAGPSFSQYQWNTGSILQQISVTNAGKFSIIATTADGCKSYDTVNVIAVWPLPIVAIRGDSTLCVGGTRLLDAGKFTGNARYLWNDGSTTQTIRIDELNIYAVQVTDEKGCINNDDFIVNKMVPNPEKFLPSDTAICSYGKLDLLPAGEYNSYLWNTNANTRLLTISRPGEYSLQVVDQNKCTGKDTISVFQKDCLRGLFVPTGFTPNGDGKNDVFRALLYGNTRLFEFSVFNRWGQLVFRTNDPYKGWDGKIGGANQSTGAFTWVCKYQLDEDPVRIERGSVVLIR